MRGRHWSRLLVDFRRRSLTGRRVNRLPGAACLEAVAAMIDGVNVEIGPRGQQLIARWALKTAAMVDCSRLQGRSSKPIRGTGGRPRSRRARGVPRSPLRLATNHRSIHQCTAPRWERRESAKH